MDTKHVVEPVTESFSVMGVCDCRGPILDIVNILVDQGMLNHSTMVFIMNDTGLLNDTVSG